MSDQPAGEALTGQHGVQERGSIWYQVSEAWHTMSQHLGLKRLQELIQGTCSLSDEPAWLLGLWYGLHNQDDHTACMPLEVQQALLRDFSSRFWFTYRRGFPAIGSSRLTSDVGWGCTLRSGQMLMAEAIARCWWGRTAAIQAHWATSSSTYSSDSDEEPAAAAADGQLASAASGPAAAADGSSEPQSQQVDQLLLLQLFLDEPSAAAPFSIHNLCSAGAAHGVVAGQWLGPWVLCKALAAAAQQAQQQQVLGLQVHVVCDPGGGAPTLQLNRLKALFAPPGSAAAGVSFEQGQRGLMPQQQGLLLLVPLTLGVGKVNERYLPQLCAVLTFPQSVGIVGGRPGASLFFVGMQGSAVLYLDPHEPREAAVLPADASSFHCSCPRLMPLAAIDPSLAIGFYCSSAAELEDLAARLQQLAASAGGAPLMTVEEPGAAAQRLRQQDQRQQQQQEHAEGQLAEEGQGAGEDWELV